MDEYAMESWRTDPDDEDLLSAEKPDPAVSAAIVAAAVLVLSCAVFVGSGLPARLHAALARTPAPAVTRAMPYGAQRVFF